MSVTSPPAPADSTVLWPDPARKAAFDRWMAQVAPAHGLDLATLAPASADASFRRYLRVARIGADLAAGAGQEGQERHAQYGAISFIVMDAPPPHEDVRPFVQVAALVAQGGLQAPRVLAADEAQGFLLLTDLGHQVCLAALQQATPPQADILMRRALQALLQWQRGVPALALPPFDAALLGRELALFPEWCVQREFGITWTASEQAIWQGVCDALVGSALAQPVVAVHADWMPRNLMLCADGQLGVLDFQDAVAGPITYDLASLLRDAFISWPEEQEIDWAVRWWEQARRHGLPVDADFGEFWRGLEWMGLQRHLKVMGIFCRLKHRDGKPQYAADLPRFFAYANRVLMRYSPLAPLAKLLEPMSGNKVESGYTF